MDAVFISAAVTLAVFGTYKSMKSEKPMLYLSVLFLGLFGLMISYQSVSNLMQIYPNIAGLIR